MPFVKLEREDYYFLDNTTVGQDKNKHRWNLENRRQWIDYTPQHCPRSLFARVYSCRASHIYFRGVQNQLLSIVPRVLVKIILEFWHDVNETPRSPSFFTDLKRDREGAMNEFVFRAGGLAQMWLSDHQSLFCKCFDKTKCVCPYIHQQSRKPQDWNPIYTSHPEAHDVQLYMNHTNLVARMTQGYMFEVYNKL